MMKYFLLFVVSVITCLYTYSQVNTDSVLKTGNRVITLSEVVVEKKLDVPGFIHRVKNDSSFYKAFRNLRILGFTSLNDIRMLDKKGSMKASLKSRTRQLHSQGCRTMDVLEEEITGDMYDDARNFNYYTAQMYASLFFTKGKVCGENNIVSGTSFSTSGKTGWDRLSPATE